MHEELLSLLQEAFTEINEMWKVCDSTQGDYVLELETATKFIQHALDTEDRLDIFRALEKACGVMEDMYNQNDGTDDLIDRLEAARDGFNESVYMKESELKSLTKAILKEIYQEPTPEHPLAQMFSKLSSLLSGGQDTNPIFTDISKGHAEAHKLFTAIIGDIKTIMKSSAPNNKKEFSRGVENYQHHSSSLMMFLASWAQTINKANPENFDKIDKVMEDLKVHITQIGAQFQQVFLALRQKNDMEKPNTINALKGLKHLNEIFASLRESIDDLFQIGLDSGYGKKDKKV